MEDSRAAGRRGPPRGLRLEQLLTVSEETDVNGRLLLEDSAPPKAQRRAVRTGVAMEAVRCAYPDAPSRQGGLMNQSAYEDLRRETAAVLNGFAWLTERCVDQAGHRRGTVRTLADVSKLGNVLPLVLLHRAADPFAPHGAIPAYVASLFKASRGVYSAAFARLTESDEEGAEAITAEEFVAYAEEGGHLRRPATERVCAAPTRLIQRTIHVILTGETADADRSGLPEVVEFPMLWRFFQLDESLSDGLDRFRYVLDQLMARTGIGDPKMLRRQLEGATGPDGQSFDDFVASFLEFANGVQTELNTTLGRTDKAPRMLFGDVLRAL